MKFVEGNDRKIGRHVSYIDKKLEEYCKQLAASPGDKQEEIRKEIGKQTARKDQYKKIEEQLKSSGEMQVSTSDPESRLLVTGNKGTEVVYNVLVTTDAEHCLPIDYKVTNSNDNRAMGNMLCRLINIIGQQNFKENLKKVLFAIFSTCKTILRRIIKILRSEPEYRYNFQGSGNIVFEPEFIGF